MRIELVPIGSVRPYPHNPRKNQGAIEKVAASLREFGWRQPIVVDPEMVVIVGHTRLMAAQRLGMSEVPVHVADLPPEKVKAYRLADNRVGEEAEWDMDLLAQELGDLRLDEYDLSLTGFDEDEIAAALAEATQGLGDPDAVPETPEVPVSVPGDVWLLGPHRIMCGDSTSVDDVDRLMDDADADMVFTDPPYGIDYSGGRTQVVATKTYGRLKNDDLEGASLGNLICNVFSFIKPEADVYICVSPIMQKPFLDYIVSRDRELDAVIVWDKKVPGLGYMAYRRQCEFILFCKGGRFKKGDKSDFDLWQIGRDGGVTYVHGTQKPVAVPARAINNSSKAGDIVLDLFGGSGSTLIACEQTGRKARLMELDPKFADVIVKRWQTFTGKTACLEGDGRSFEQMANARGRSLAAPVSREKADANGEQQ